MQSAEISSTHEGSVLVLIWAILIAFVNYYLLNLTVAALCLAFSESMTQESMLCEPPKKSSEDDDENNADDEVRQQKILF